MAGWFSDERADPLCDTAGPKDKAQVRWSERLQQNQWSIPKGSEFLPTAVTCYGSAPGIKWTPNEACSTTHLQSITFALGNSSIEALAALAKANGTDEVRDRLVSELQFAALAERRPTRREMDDPHFFKTLGQMLGGCAKLHERAFSARDGGTFWEIAAPLKERDSRDANAQPLPKLPPDVSAQLANLNQKQRECDEAARALDAWRGRLFAAWCRQQFRSASDPEFEPAKKEVETRDPQLTTLLGQRAKAEGDLRALLPKKSNGEPEFELIARAAPRFWQASDPFVLTAGLPVPALQGGASPLECRVSGQTIAGLKVLSVQRYGTVEVTRADLKNYLSSQNFLPPPRDGMPPDFADLMLDALFTDRQRAELLARVYFAQVQKNGNPSEQQIKDVRDAIDSGQDRIERAVAGVNGGPSTPDPVPLTVTGELALQKSALRSLLSAVRLPWPSTPIRPVYMVWKANWHSDFPDASRPASRPWGLADGVECRWIGSPPPAGGDSVIEGFAPITTGLERGLETSKQKFAETYGLAFERLAKLAGQSLMGLTDALAGRAPGPHLGPLTTERTGIISVDPIAALVKDQYAAAPFLGDDGGPSFSPLRGGRLKLTQLWIVDSFGRIQPVPGEPILSRTLAGAEPDGSAHLLPRLVQPARLLLRWLSARDDKQETFGDLGASPICGFVVHNRIDRSLLIYDAREATENSGATLLGAVQAINLPQGQEEVRWTKMPARPFDVNSASERRPGEADIPDKTLRNFVNGLLGGPGGESGTAFKAFRALLDRREDEADLSLDQGLQAVLAGRPLALVRASLRLEFDGAPAADPRLATDPGTQDPWFRGLKFPVRLGDRRLGPDGLVGYFVDDGSPGAYAKLRPRADETLSPELSANAYFDSRISRCRSIRKQSRSSSPCCSIPSEG